MAKDLSRHQQGIVKRYYEHQDTIQSQKVSEIVSDLWLAADEKIQTRLWGKAQVALMRMGLDPKRVANVVGRRDLESLAKLVAEADAGTAKTASPTDLKPRVPSAADGRTIGQARADRVAEGGFDSLEEVNLKRALRAFRRKLKLLRRDDESRLGNRYVSSGRPSDICAITPPTEYPQPVWDKLVELGRLKRAGQGTFELP